MTLEELERASMDDIDAVNSTEKIGAKCFVESSGKVNCSDIIYEDERTWRKSRNQIDLLIQVLKSKISDLKGIKKHLKHNKPSGMDEDDSSEESSSVEDTQTTTRKSTVEPHSTKKFNNNHHFESSSTVAMNEYSTTAISLTTDADAKLSFQSSSATSPLTTVMRTTKTPSVIVRRPSHRTSNSSTAHRNHIHHHFPNGTSKHNHSAIRRPTPPSNENSTISHRSIDHRRNSTRHHKNGNATTRKMPTTTSATPSISTTVSTVSATAEDTFQLSTTATTAIDSLITFIDSVKNETPKSTTEDVPYISNNNEGSTKVDGSTVQFDDERKSSTQGTIISLLSIFENTIN